MQRKTLHNLKPHEIKTFNPIDLNEPGGWIGHTPFAYWLIPILQPASFVELGTHTGNSYFSFCQSIKENATSTKAYAIDTWQGDEHAGFYGDNVFESVNKLNEKYANFSSLVRKTFDEALEEFNNSSIELLHIDGLHTYEAVLHDFEAWLPKMAPGGLVLFHDINVFERDFGVHKFWSEVTQEYNSLEFSHSHGLGVIEIPGKSEKTIPENDQAKKEIIAKFQILGENTKLTFENKNLSMQNQALGQELETIRNERRALILQRDEILNSKSWKATRILRTVQKFIKS